MTTTTGVFAGWSASDLTCTVTDAASLAYYVRGVSGFHVSRSARPWKGRFPCVPLSWLCLVLVAGLRTRQSAVATVVSGGAFRTLAAAAPAAVECAAVAVAVKPWKRGGGSSCLKQHAPSVLCCLFFLQVMLPTDPIYGFATFNLTGQNGFPYPYDIAYGHIGVRALSLLNARWRSRPLANTFCSKTPCLSLPVVKATYGYQSILSFHPSLNATIAIARCVLRFCSFGRALTVFLTTPAAVASPALLSRGCSCAMLASFVDRFC